MSDIRQILPSHESSDSWLMAQLAVRPRHTRRRSIIIVAAATAVIGWIDHWSGFLVSFELFYLVPITMAVAWLGATAGSITAVVGIVVRGTGDVLTDPSPVPLTTYWNWFTDLLGFLIVVWVLNRLIVVYRELDNRVVERTRALQDSIRTRRKLEYESRDVAARERNAIGQELHDGLCQQLVGSAFATKVLAERLSASDLVAARSAQAIVGQIEDGIGTARRLAYDLLLESVPPDELSNALAELAAESTGDTVRCRFVLEGNPAIPDSATGGQLLRIAQEAVRNALRHANPTRLEIVLGGNPETSFLIIKDDGCGIPSPGEHGGGMGLQIMEQRAARIGGILSIRPATGSKGTAVICHLPRSIPASPSKAGPADANLNRRARR